MKNRKIKNINFQYLVITTVFAFAFYNSFCQSVFNNLYDYYNDHEWGIAAIQTLDGGYIAVGDAITSSTMDALFVVKTDSKGDTTWTKGYHLSPPMGGVLGNSIIQLADSSFVICGHNYDSIEKASDTYLIKLNLYGDSLWFKIIEGGVNDRAYEL